MKRRTEDRAMKGEKMEELTIHKARLLYSVNAFFFCFFFLVATLTVVYVKFLSYDIVGFLIICMYIVSSMKFCFQKKKNKNKFSLSVVSDGAQLAPTIDSARESIKKSFSLQYYIVFQLVSCFHYLYH